MTDLQLPAKLRPLFDKATYKVLYGGRGGTKSWGIARSLLVQGTREPLRVLCARETQKSIRDSVHRLLADQIIALDLHNFYQVLKSEIRGINGTEFVFAGLSTLTVDSIKSFEGVDRCWVEEAQVVSKRSWSILIPTIRKASAETWISFNPDLDTDDTWVRFIENTPPDAVLIPVSYRDNPWLSDKFIKDMEHLKRTDPVAFENIYEGKCRAAAEGAIYTPEVTALATSKRVCAVPVDPMLEVHTVWDLGFNDSCAIICVQRQLSELRIVDYLEDSQRTMSDYVRMLKEKQYRYGTDWLPWDGADSKYRLTGEGTSPESILRKMGRRVVIVPQVDVEVGIKKARLVFPRCYFDKEHTVRLRECLKRYRRVIPSTTEEPSHPMHDEFSHGADAFRYMSIIADRIVDGGWSREKIVYPKKAYA